MNKLILLIALSLTGCHKCMTCTTTTTTSVSVPTPGYPQTTTVTADYCDEDLKRINGTEQSATVKSGGISATSTAKTTCR